MFLKKILRRECFPTVSNFPSQVIRAEKAGFLAPQYTAFSLFVVVLMKEEREFISHLGVQHY